MKFDKSSLLLYAVTDRSWCQNENLVSQTKKALLGGVTFVQIREKHISQDEFYNEAIELKNLCAEFKVPFVVNDDVQLAKKINADGVHIGQNDMALLEAKKVLGPQKIIGVSVQTVSQALLAEKQGATYLGVGSVFNTSSKDDAEKISLETLKNITSAVKIPVVAIGGINLQNVKELSQSGICGIAVISAIFAQKDITNSTKDLLCETKKALKL